MRVLFLTVLLLATCVLMAQPDKEAILKPINDLFAAMKEGDSVKAHRAFAEGSNFEMIISNRDKKPYVKVKLKDFIKAVGAPRKEKMNEVMWDAVVQQDRAFAQVWANYAFYRGNTFSHCGIDAFQLVRVGADWKIVNLSYTVATQDCQVPQEIVDRFR